VRFLRGPATVTGELEQGHCFLTCKGKEDGKALKER